MATLTTYYYDAPNFKLATCVFTDEALTVVAPAGVYSDGGFYRELTVSGGNGSLGPVLSCPDCFTACQSPNVFDLQDTNPSPTVPPDRYEGTWRVPFILEEGLSSVGAVVIRVYYREQPPLPNLGHSEPLGLLAYRQTGNYENVISGGGSPEYTYYTNNFSGTGSIAGTCTVANSTAEPGFPSLGCEDGGSVKNVGNAVALPDNVLDKPVWFGSRAQTGGGTNYFQDPYDAVNPCNTTVPQLPENLPFTGTGSTLTVTRAAQPTWLFNWNNLKFELQAGTADIVIEQQQSQIDTQPSDPFDGFHGWLTCVVPKSSPIPETVWLEIQNVNCSGGALMQISCPQELPSFGCSIPYGTQSDACQASLSETDFITLYHVPGAVGIVGNAPSETFEGGVPNRWDIVCSTENGEPLPDNQKSKWYKYLDPDNNQRLFYIDEYSVITETDVTCVIEPIDLSTPFGNDSSASGGGIYSAETVIPAATQGAVIVRVNTGNVPLGLFVNHVNANNTSIINQSNLFSVRGSTNLDGFLSQNDYLMNSDSNNVESITGYNTGGASSIMGQYNSQGDFSALSGNNTSDTFTIFNLYDYTNPINPVLGTNTNCDMPGQPPCAIINNNIPGYTNIEMPVFIGKSETTTAAIPCTNGDTSTVDCSVGFANPEGGGTVVNQTGIINLPSNGNHLYGENQLANPVGGNTEGQATLFSYPITSGNINNIAESSAGLPTSDLFFSYSYPIDTTGCNPEGLYPRRVLDGLSGEYVNSGSTSKIYVAPFQVQLYSSENNDKGPGWSMCVIPKTSADEERVRLDIYSLTSSTEFSAQIDVVTLPSVTVYGPNTSAQNNTLCGGGALPPAVTAYIAHNAFGGVEGPCIPGVAGLAGTPCAQANLMNVNIPYLNDMIFTDANGENKLAGGLYFYQDGGSSYTMRVDDFGVVTCIKDCTGGGSNQCT
tara:strand:+ start:1307 stop:4129 length:2823 start_codon:yes stop_codon:yes gene_type:complete